MEEKKNAFRRLLEQSRKKKMEAKIKPASPVMGKNVDIFFKTYISMFPPWPSGSP